MSYIKTWAERCDEHPDHQSGMVSTGMIRARMQEEIDELRTENERLTGLSKQVAEALNDTLSKYHEVGDQVDKLDAENERLRAEIERMHDSFKNLALRLRRKLEAKP